MSASRIEKVEVVIININYCRNEEGNTAPGQRKNEPRKTELELLLDRKGNH